MPRDFDNGDNTSSLAKHIKDELKDGHTGAAALEVEAFWKDHHADGQWDKLMSDLYSTKDCDPSVKALLGNFHISYTEKDGDATHLEVKYTDHGVGYDDNFDVKDLKPHFPPLEPIDPPHQPPMDPPPPHEPPDVPPPHQEPPLLPPGLLDPPPTGRSPLPPFDGLPPYTGGIEEDGDNKNQDPVNH